MRGRLVLAIISTIAEESLILILGLWLLPQFGVNIPLPAIPVVMLVWLAWSVFVYRKGTRALLNKPVQGMVNMIGSSGIVTEALKPEGMVKIRGELWYGRSQSEYIDVGTRVVVVKQYGLKLEVRPEPAVSGRQPTIR